MGEGFFIPDSGQIFLDFDSPGPLFGPDPVGEDFINAFGIPNPEERIAESLAAFLDASAREQTRNIEIIEEIEAEREAEPVNPGPTGEEGFLRRAEELLALPQGTLQAVSPELLDAIATQLNISVQSLLETAPRSVSQFPQVEANRVLIPPPQILFPGDTSEGQPVPIPDPEVGDDAPLPPEQECSTLRLIVNAVFGLRGGGDVNLRQVLNLFRAGGAPAIGLGRDPIPSTAGARTVDGACPGFFMEPERRCCCTCAVPVRKCCGNCEGCT